MYLPTIFLLSQKISINGRSIEGYSAFKEQPDSDGLLVELLKADCHKSAQDLRPIIEYVWAKETIPNEWKTDLIIKLQ